MIRREDFIEAMGAPDADFDRAVDAALRQVKESEAKPVMKRKMTLTLLAAIIAVIALTGAALAVGFNLFGYFGEFDRRLQVIAPEAVVEDASAVEIATDHLGVTKAQIDSAYYDGQSLIVAYSLDNSRRYERYAPTEAELAEMTEDEDFFLEPDEAANDQLEAVRAFQAAIDQKQPFGIVEYEVAVTDHCFTDDGVDLPPSTEAVDSRGDGTLYCIREFETPLPEAARGRDSLSIKLPVALYTAWHWFDGERFYSRYQQQPLTEMTAIVSRVEGVTRGYGWEGSINGAKVTAEARVSAVHVKLRIRAEGDAFPDPVEIWPEVADADDTWYSFVLTDSKGMEYRFSAGIEGEGEVEAEYDGLGYLPDDLTLTVCLDGEGAWNAEDHILPGFPVTLKLE